MAIVTSSQQTDTHSAPAANGPRHPGRSIPVALLAFLGVLFFLNIVSRLCVGPLLPVVEREFGLRHSGAGSLYFFLAAGSCVGLYLSGHVAWRLSHRATIAVSGMTLGTALVAIAFTPSLFGIRAELLLLGIGAGLYLPSGVAVLTENSHEGSWGKVLAIHELGPNLGYICAPLIAELLLGVFSWQGVLGSMGVPAILLSGAFLLSGLGETAPAQRPGGAALALLARDRSFWGVAGLFAVSIGLGLGIYSMMPLFLVNDVGMDRVHANLITGLSRISGLFSVFVAGTLADRIGRPRTVMFSLAAAGTCAILLGVAQGPWITPLLGLLPGRVRGILLSRRLRPSVLGLSPFRPKSRRVDGLDRGHALRGGRGAAPHRSSGGRRLLLVPRSAPQERLDPSAIQQMETLRCERRTRTGTHRPVCVGDSGGPGHSTRDVGLQVALGFGAPLKRSCRALSGRRLFGIDIDPWSCPGPRRELALASPRTPGGSTT